MKEKDKRDEGESLMFYTLRKELGGDDAYINAVKLIYNCSY